MNREFKTAISSVQLSLLLALSLLSCSSDKGRQAKHDVNPDCVYICTGGSAKRYHSVNDCKGLSRCSDSIIEMTVEEAEDYGRTPCRMCCH